MAESVDAMSDPVTQAAVSYGALGVLVTPGNVLERQPFERCSCGDRACPTPGLHPRLAEGTRRWFRDAESIEHLFNRYPGSNVILGTGGASGIVVLAVDTQSGPSLAEVIERYPSAETAARARTETGFHLYFRHTGQSVPSRTAIDGPGLDLIGDGESFVLAPPSLHPSGTFYTWITPLPDPLHKLPALPGPLVAIARA